MWNRLTNRNYLQYALKHILNSVTLLIRFWWWTKAWWGPLSELGSAADEDPGPWSAGEVCADFPVGIQLHQYPLAGPQFVTQHLPELGTVGPGATAGLVVGPLEGASPARAQGFSVCGPAGILPAENTTDFWEKGSVDIHSRKLQKNVYCNEGLPVKTSELISLMYTCLPRKTINMHALVWLMVNFWRLSHLLIIFYRPKSIWTKL